MSEASTHPPADALSANALKTGRVPRMARVALRWIALPAGAFVLGPALAWVAGQPVAPDGSADATLLVNTSLTRSLVRGMAAAVVVLAWTTCWARLASARSALLSTGLASVHVVYAWGRPDALLRAGHEGAIYGPLVLEACALGALMMLTVFAASALGHQPQLPEPPTNAEHPSTTQPRVLLIKLAVGVAIWLGAVWAVAQTGLTSQGLAAGVLAALATSSLTQAAGQGIVSAPFRPLGEAACCVALGAVLCRLLAGSVPAFANLMPADAFAGAFIGLPIGASWAMSIANFEPTTADNHADAADADAQGQSSSAG